MFPPDLVIRRKRSVSSPVIKEQVPLGPRPEWNKPSFLKTSFLKAILVPKGNRGYLSFVLFCP